MTYSVVHSDEYPPQCWQLASVKHMPDAKRTRLIGETTVSIRCEYAVFRGRSPIAWCETESCAENIALALNGRNAEARDRFHIAARANPKQLVCEHEPLLNLWYPEMRYLCSDCGLDVTVELLAEVGLVVKSV